MQEFAFSLRKSAYEKNGRRKIFTRIVTQNNILLESQSFNFNVPGQVCRQSAIKSLTVLLCSYFYKTTNLFLNCVRSCQINNKVSVMLIKLCADFQ